ncbi:PREDICTED: 39S ribosomal protein L45, mitochondrial [Nanorana parkeri]|uniref:39S ribosomal protein L45, mitochondrial n=1 Tax=Nanorana parkeri TaxID=125878 RepID=UPI0008548AD6|nr:PREDICTED: 39S ribosomal protein L45, mitochondrial [Nanorana parkeri]
MDSDDFIADLLIQGPVRHPHLETLRLGIVSLLNPSRLMIPILLHPVRTKKRFFMPPSVGAKYNTAEEMARKAKAAGIIVPEEIMERPINVSCTAGIFEPYVPPEGDARLSTLSKDGLKQRTEQLKQTAASYLAIRRVKNYDEEFSTKSFPEKAQEIFITAHKYLTLFDRHKLHNLVTERCYPEMVRGNRYRTIHWSFVESLEAPRVVQVRCPEMVSKGNVYSQVTVRMYSKQTLIIYDRFGRVECGKDKPRDVLEYVVFERHLVNPYGAWRMHGKIVPAWAPPKELIVKTVVIPGPVLKPWQKLEDLELEGENPAPMQ